MSTLVVAVLVGVASGLRAFMGLAAVCWAARLGWLHLEGTRLAFLGYAATPWIASLLAAGELVTDQLPSTPSRLVPPQFGARLATGALCGAAIGASGGKLLLGLVAGLAGAALGTLSGARVRAALAKAFGRDTPAALIEDAIAISLAFFAVHSGAM